MRTNPCNHNGNLFLEESVVWPWCTIPPASISPKIRLSMVSFWLSSLFFVSLLTDWPKNRESCFTITQLNSSLRSGQKFKSYNAAIILLIVLWMWGGPLYLEGTFFCSGVQKFKSKGPILHDCSEKAMEDYASRHPLIHPDIAHRCSRTLTIHPYE